MFDTDKTPYKITFLGKKEIIGQNSLIAKSLFRFEASKRKYLVTIEHFNFGVDAIKYCDLKDKDSRNAYTKIFNDQDGFKVLATCLKIMHNLWKNNSNLSFAFYAAPRPRSFDKLKKSRHDRVIGDEQYQEKYIRSRFNVYEHAMINLFPPNFFWKAKDYKNCIYVLLNKKSKKGTNRLHQIGKYLLENYEIIFEVDGKVQQPKNIMRIG